MTVNKTELSVKWFVPFIFNDQCRKAISLALKDFILTCKGSLLFLIHVTFCSVSVRSQYWSRELYYLLFKQTTWNLEENNTLYRSTIHWDFEVVEVAVCQMILKSLHSCTCCADVMRALHIQQFNRIHLHNVRLLKYISWVDLSNICCLINFIVYMHVRAII